MTCRLFYTDLECTAADYQAEKTFYIPLVYERLDEALGAAQRIIAVGGIPWEIETESGVLGRIDILKLTQ